MSQIPKPSQNQQPFKRKANLRIWFYASECKYEVILNRVKTLNWKIIEDEKNEPRCNIYWVDIAAIHERIKVLLAWQVVNHFPGMPNIARKNRMGQNLNRMAKIYPREYGFYPRTWVLPSELSDFRSQFDNLGNSIGNKIFIIKPDTGCQGRGIFLTRSFDAIPQQEAVVAQVYIKKPLLLDGFKFDLRIYVLVTSVKPLRIYLFKDGLVRMCTEEYVKPTKQNLSSVCMHLTNYAVNKHNANFQQPSAKSSTLETPDENSSKRSLLWFMNWIKSQYSENKAEWLWKRIGVVVVRTILSIIPTLSREYDFHFKGFQNIPIDINSITTTGGGGITGTTGVSGSSSNSNDSNSINKDDNNDVDKQNSNNNSNRSSAEKGLGGGDQPNENESTSSTGNTTSHENLNTNGSNSNNSKDGRQFRGSRCFEILGFDIMLDSKLKPWVIEVNHLPSFGTDSPLDGDIKSRLMEEVFNVLSVLPDDESAYLAYHKAEAEKRLTVERTAASLGKTREKAVSEREREKEREDERRKERERERERNKARSKEKSLQLQKEKEAKLLADGNNNLANLNRIQEIRNFLVTVYEKHSPEKVNKVDKLLERYQGREEEFLSFVLQKYNITDPPIKPMTSTTNTSTTNAPLLRSTSDIEPVGGTTITLSSLKSEGDPLTEGVRDPLDASNNSNNDGSTTNRGKEGVRGRENATAPAAVADRTKVAKQLSRYTRSLSPPQHNDSSRQPTRRASAMWRGAGPEEEAQFREEILSQHVPVPTDPWLLWEDQMLPSFTRLFPVPVTPTTPLTYFSSPEYSSSSSSATITTDIRNLSDLNTSNTINGHTSNTNTMTTSGVSNKLRHNSLVKNTSDDDGDQEEEENSDDGEDGGGALRSSGQNESSEKDSGAVGDNGQSSSAKSNRLANFEEILVQVFVQDKRQTMRLRCPLPSRSVPPDTERGGDTRSLPPLAEEYTNNKSSSIGSSQLLKSGPGWRPPPQLEKKEGTLVNKVPTQTQIEAAARLSKGLSAAPSSASSKMNSNITGVAGIPRAAFLNSVYYDQNNYSNNGITGTHGNGSYNGSTGDTNYITGAGGGSQQVTTASNGVGNGGIFMQQNGELIMMSRTRAMEAIQEKERQQQQQQQQQLAVTNNTQKRQQPAAVLRQQIFQFDSFASQPPPPSSQIPSSLAYILPTTIQPSYYSNRPHLGGASGVTAAVTGGNNNLNNNNHNAQYGPGEGIPPGWL